MSSDGLPDVVASFLRDHMRNREDLHLLVAVSSSDQRWWDDATVATELFMDRAQARGVLEHLAAHNLLEIRLTEDVRYQFRPGTPQLRDAALSAVAAYRSRPDAVLHALGDQRHQRGVRDFSDAFRIRRDRR